MVVEGPSSANLRDPSRYTLKELGPYNAATYKPGTPYVAAEISSASFVNKFFIGDGKDYLRSNRKRRHTRGIKYSNIALKPDTPYSVFQRAFLSNVSKPSVSSFLQFFPRGCIAEDECILSC